jgi:hypothetical protein
MLLEYGIEIMVQGIRLELEIRRHLLRHSVSGKRGHVRGGHKRASPRLERQGRSSHWSLNPKP